MKERPILFSGPMVRAILEGRKTQTRRIMKPQPELKIMEDGQPRKLLGMVDPSLNPDGWTWKGCRYMPWPTSSAVRAQCPFGDPNYEPSALWVRETFCERAGDIIYRADGTFEQPWHCTSFEESDRWKPSLFMPRWASRITLEVVSVRVERLRDISNEDAFAEGCTAYPDREYWAQDPGGPIVLADTPRDEYQQLWESINGHLSWHLNPWVWVVEFKRVQP